jgi:serine/threonine protein phosphatase 1
MSERIYYAIGDVHGEYERLRDLHDAIDAHWKLEGGGRPATVLHLGDYVDRGPDSAGVISYLMELQSKADLHPEITIVCLLGNHERLMIDAVEADEHGKMMNWLMNGGEQTVESYRRAGGVGALAELVPRAHIDWLKTLPTQIVDRDAGLVFVHAGVQPNTFPKCTEEVRLWTRSPKFFNDRKWPANPELDGLMVVHGHTPTDGEPYLGPRRVNLDTGACYGGPLTAAMFKDKGSPVFFSVRRPGS